MNCLRCNVFFLFFVFSLFCGAAGADSGNDQLSAFLQAVEEKAAGIASFTCSFEQQRHLAIFSRPVTFHGRLALVRPDRLRWEVISPIPSAMIFNGTTGLRCSGQSPPTRFDLDEDPVMRMVARQLWTWMDSSYADLLASYHIEMISQGTLLLTPREKAFSKIINAIRIEFDPETLQPARVVILETGEDYTEISFSGYDFSPNLSETDFSQCPKQ